MAYFLSSLTTDNGLVTGGAFSAVATSDITGTVAVNQGGTGQTALTAHYLLIGNGTSAVTLLAPGTSGYPLLSQGASSDPAYGVLTVAAGGTGATDAATARTNLGLGTAAVKNTGTSGNNVPLLDGANTWTALQTLSYGSSGGGIDAYVSSTSAAVARFFLARARGSVGSESAISSGDVLGTVAWGGHDGSTWSGSKAFIQATAAGNWSGSAHGTDMSFWVTNSATDVTARGLYFSTGARCGMGASAGSVTPVGQLDVRNLTTSIPVLSLRSAASRTVAPVQIVTSAGGLCGNPGGITFTHQTDGASTHTDGTEDDLYSVTTVANYFEANGDGCEAYYVLNLAGHATATRRVQAYFGGTSLFDSGTLTTASAVTAILRIGIVRASSTSVRCVADFVYGTTRLNPTYTLITGLTLSSTNILKVTGIAASTGAASGDITGKLGKVSWTSMG